MNSPSNQCAKAGLRIIAGQYRRRKVYFQPREGLRPTCDRIRETLFAWLDPYLPGSRVLDLYAGSGILGLEALSRGACTATFIDAHQGSLQMIKENAEVLGCGHRVYTERMTLPGPLPGPADIIFLDPPFQDHDISEDLQCLQQSGLLTEEVLVYIETARDDDVEYPGLVKIKQCTTAHLAATLYKVEKKEGVCLE